MSMRTGIEILNENAWRELAGGYMDYSYRQVWEFGVACASRIGATSEHVAIRQDGELLGLADVRVKRIPAVHTGIAYINGGPLVRRTEGRDAETLRRCLEVLAQEYVSGRGLVLRVMAPVADEEWTNGQKAVFSWAGFRPSAAARAYRTLLVDVDWPLDAVRKGLAQKWRNCLNQAEKKDLVVRSGTDPSLFREFCDLFSRFIEQKGFCVDLTPPFYLAVHEQVSEQDRFYISLADMGGTLVAGHVASFLGDTCVYLLGASSPEGLRHKASYLLQWHVIQRAHQRGLRWYDLGGIDPEGNPGVYHFKKGLGGADVCAAGPYELAPSDTKRSMVLWGEKVHGLWHHVSASASSST